MCYMKADITGLAPNVAPCSSRNIVWVISWRRLINTYRVLARKPEKKGSLRKPMHMWNDSVRMDVREIGFWGTD